MLQEYAAYKRLPFVLDHAHANHLDTTDRVNLLDLYGGHCVNTLGAGDETLGAALASQWKQCSFTTNLLETAGRSEFLEALAPGLPEGDWQVFCTNSGAEANENALKMALAATKRDTVVAFEGAFHGRTAAASSVSDEKVASWPSSPFRVKRSPWGATGQIDDSVGAVIIEPIQSLAGVVMPPEGFLQALRKACDQAGALLIFDEVQTGNGRLGTMWGSQYFGVTPDLFTTAKGCAGGFPLGLTFLAAQLVDVIPSGLCGSTFGGGPMALAAATHVQRQLASPGFLKRVRATGALLEGLAGVGPIAAVRGAGLLLGLEIESATTAREVRDVLLELGVLTGLCADPQILRLSPALTMTAENVAQLRDALHSLGVPS